MNQSLRTFVRGFVFASAGIVHAVRTQRNMKIHLLISLMVVLLGVWLKISSVEWAIIALTMGSVLSIEMMNTVVENAIDLASPGIHPLAKMAKDVSAGAVLTVAIFAAVVGALIFLPKLSVMLAR